MPKSGDIVNQSGGPPDDDPLELMHAVMHLYRARQYRAVKSGHEGLTHMDSKVLAFFGRRPGATQSDLVAHSGRDKAQLARLIKGLRERGLLQAAVDDADRRNLRLSLTAEGLALQRSLQREARSAAARAVAGLGETDRRRLVALLQHVRANLKTED